VLLTCTLTFFPNIFMGKLWRCFVRSPPLVPIVQMWALVVVETQPLVQLLLQVVELLPKLHPKGLRQHRLVETFREPVGLRAFGLRLAVLDVVELHMGLACHASLAKILRNVAQDFRQLQHARS